MVPHAWPSDRNGRNDHRTNHDPAENKVVCRPQPDSMIRIGHILLLLPKMLLRIQFPHRS